MTRSHRGQRAVVSHITLPHLIQYDAISVRALHASWRQPLSPDSVHLLLLSFQYGADPRFHYQHMNRKTMDIHVVQHRIPFQCVSRKKTNLCSTRLQCERQTFSFVLCLKRSPCIYKAVNKHTSASNVLCSQLLALNMIHQTIQRVSAHNPCTVH